MVFASGAPVKKSEDKMNRDGSAEPCSNHSKVATPSPNTTCYLRVVVSSVFLNSEFTLHSVVQATPCQQCRIIEGEQSFFFCSCP